MAECSFFFICVFVFVACAIKKRVSQKKKKKSAHGWCVRHTRNMRATRLDIVKRLMLQFAVFIRRCHREEAPSPVCNKLKATSHGNQTRGNKASYCPYRPYTISGSKCFSARGPLLWNALPVSIREEKHLLSFKNKLLAFVDSRSNFNKLYDICASVIPRAFNRFSFQFYFFLLRSITPLLHLSVLSSLFPVSSFLSFRFLSFLFHFHLFCAS